MQVTKLLPLLAAVSSVVYGQNFQQGRGQFFQSQQPLPQHYQAWQNWRQPQYYPPQQQQQPQQFPAQHPAQINYQPNSIMFVSAPQQHQQHQQHQQQMFQQFPSQQPQALQFRPFQHQYQPQVQQQRFPLQQFRPPPSPLPLQPQLQRGAFSPKATPNQQARIYRQQFKISKPTPSKLHEPQHVEPRLEISQRSLPDGLYGGDKKSANSFHLSYIEDVVKTSPVKKSGRVLKPQMVVPKQEAQLRTPEATVPVTRRPSPKPKLVSQKRISTTARPTHGPESSLIKAVPKVAVPTDSSKNPNRVFLNCCKAMKVAKSCERICNFDILNKKTLTGMFLGTDPCPQSYGLNLLQCAAQSEDHTTCCRARGVHTTAARDKCLGFCNMRPGVNFQADVSMLPCWAVLNDIKTCFTDHIKNS